MPRRNAKAAPGRDQQHDRSGPMIWPDPPPPRAIRHRVRISKHTRRTRRAGPMRVGPDVREPRYIGRDTAEPPPRAGG